jgi:hypothetical protein
MRGIGTAPTSATHYLHRHASSRLLKKCFLQADQRLKGGGAFEPQIRWVFFNSLLENRKYANDKLQNVAYDPANV